MAKRRVKTRFFVFMGILLSLLAAALFVLLGGGGENVVEYGSIVYEKTEEVVILRDEKVIAADSYAKIVYFSLEGQHVDKDEKVAEIYKSGFNEAMRKDLISRQEEILKLQEMLQQDVINPELDAHNANIREKMDKIAALAQGETRGDMLTFEHELKDAMEARRVYLKENMLPTPELTQLYEKEQADVDKIENYRQEVIAESQGIASFYFDGYETLLNPALLNELTQESVAKIIKDGPKSAGAYSEKPIYRLINEQRWYCLLPRSKDQDKSPLNDKGPYEIVFAGFYDTVYSGTLEKINEQTAGVLYIFEITGSAPIIERRNIQATIKRTFEGLKVPLKALLKSEGVEGIYLLNSGAKEFTPVTVLVKDEQSAIIAPLDGSTSIKPGMRYSS